MGQVCLGRLSRAGDGVASVEGLSAGWRPPDTQAQAGLWGALGALALCAPHPLPGAVLTLQLCRGRKPE